jgi:sulfur relay (sulfurtransferase) DsrF/TusC family protein
MKTLQIVTSAYRCNVEEQDDPVLWIAQAMKGAGADVHVLLEGDAVNYAAREQDASGLSFGGKAQTEPARIEKDLRRLVDKGAEVFIVEDDMAERGLERDDLVAGLQGVSRSGLARLFGRFDEVWRW